MSLAIEYRPAEFEEFEGNEDVVASIQALLEREQKDIPHSWLFTGPSGCGKTTLARIVASQLGCRGADFYEIDAAGENGINMIRSIREQMNYRPIESDCRVWLLDECHMLTTQGQEALLKALEDTPSHIYFMLATTEPNKLKTTLKNRCVDFNVTPLGEREMKAFLTEIVSCEEKEVPADVIKDIAISSLGSSRAALQYLDKIIDLPKDKMLDAVKREAVKQNAVIELCRALIESKPWKIVSKIIKGLEKEDPEGIRQAVLRYCNSVLLSGKDAPLAYLIMESFKDPFFNNGVAGVTMASYEALQGTNEENMPF